MTDTFTIKMANEKDLGEINELIQEEFSYVSRTAEELKEAIEEKSLVLFKASQGTMLAGFIEMQFLPEGKARINGLTIKKSYRRKNAGKQLVGRALSFLEEQGVETVQLLVKQSNEKAKTLYKQFGFEYARMYDKTLEGEKVEEMELSFFTAPRQAA